MNLARMTYLNWQRDLRENRKLEEEEKERYEKAMLTQEWQAEKERQRQRELERAKLMRERNLEILDHNEYTRQLKLQEELEEKERDK